MDEMQIDFSQLQKFWNILPFTQIGGVLPEKQIQVIFPRKYQTPSANFEGFCRL